MDESLTATPLALRDWRQTDREQRFVQALTEVGQSIDAMRHPGALFHAASFFCLNRASIVFDQLREMRVDARPEPLPPDDPKTEQIEFALWTLLQSAKATLDSLGREVNLIYWHIDGEGRFFDPLAKARWTSFYTVRQKLLLYDSFKSDPVSRALRKHTSGDTADAAYLTLSHLANASLVAPLIVGPVTPLTEGASGQLKVGQSRVRLPDDPRAARLTYSRGLKINSLGQEVLHWLDRFLDQVYGDLTPALQRLKRTG